MENQIIVNTRLNNQQIIKPVFNDPEQLVSWLGAVQAQDYEMAKWAIGLRLPHTKMKEIEAFLCEDLIRTHILRPTWHIVSAKDVHWMMDLTMPRIKPILNTYSKKIELSPELKNKIYATLEKYLVNDNYLTKDEIIGIFEKEKIEIEKNRLSLLLFHAELDKLVCNGIPKGKKQTYALFDERVKEKNSLPEEESLSLLATKYFQSHSPATLNDFSWWSGLTITQAKKALASIGTSLEQLTIDSVIYYYMGQISDTPDNSLFLVPAYDEYVISYKSRRMIFKYSNYEEVINNFGIFKPVIVYNGQVIGKWRRIKTKNKVTVEPFLFNKHNKKVINLLDMAIEAFENYIN